MPDEIVMRHRTPHFAHIFANDSYSAGYYSYLWAEVLDHDAFEAFVQEGDPFDKTIAKRLHDDIMCVGNSVDPGQAYRNFRGREPRIDALLRARGFAVQPCLKRLKVSGVMTMPAMVQDDSKHNLVQPNAAHQYTVTPADSAAVTAPCPACSCGTRILACTSPSKPPAGRSVRIAAPSTPSCARPTKSSSPGAQ